MIKVFKSLIDAWGIVVLFLAGMCAIAVASFTFNLIVGWLVTGIELCLMACILDKERG